MLRFVSLAKDEKRAESIKASIQPLMPLHIVGRVGAASTLMPGRKHTRMNGQIDLITLISLIVAAVAIFKLRSVLGQRTDEDDHRVERLKTREREAREAHDGATGQVITLPQRPRDDGAPAIVTEPEVDAEARIKAYETSDPEVTAGLLKIAKLDPQLDPAGFLKGATAAYEMIVSAFADGDRKALKELLSREVYEGFVEAIGEREKRGERIDQQFVGIKRADIIDADLQRDTALITVRFVSELITAVLDGSGTVVSGDTQKISDVTDIWTFSRDISSARARNNPNWYLEETQAPN